MKNLKKISLLITCIICVYLIVQITLKQVDPIVINTIDPVSIVAGQDFNIFENKSTMALYGKGFKTGDIIYLNDIPQDTAVGNEGWMTCFVDREVYELPGKLEIEVKRINEKGKVIKRSEKHTIIME